MSFIKRWDVDDIQRQIDACAAEVNYVKHDGFTQWYCKQDLIRVKYQLDEILRTAPKFADEDKFIAELEKNIVWKRLNEKTN